MDTIRSQKLQKFFFPILTKESCPRKLLLSFCAGAYIAFSPFVGLHTAMVFLFSWLFTLNIPVTLTVSCLINNPWTMVPIYASEHFLGKKVLLVLGIDAFVFNPSWFSALNNFLQTRVGIHGISLFAFFLGGNIIAIIIPLLLYPVFKKIIESRAAS